MPQENVIQTDFLAGELSPRMELQDNIEGRKHGAELMRNWAPHLQGSAETVPGTEFLQAIAETTGRIFSFPVSATEGFVIFIGIVDILINDADVSGASSFTSPWTTGDDINAIQAVMAPDEQSLYLVSPGVAPRRLTFERVDPSTTIWAFELIVFVDPPALWTGTSWPGVIGFYSGRMWLSGVAEDPAVFWGSKSSEYTDFTLGTLADDAIEWRLDRRGAIRWIVGGQGLVIGTENAEHVISSSEGLIRPGDILSKMQSSNGSIAAQALEVGNEIMYISPEGRKIRSIEYEWNKDAWRSRDITYASEHITGGGNSLRHLHYSANPNSRIIGTTLLNEMIFATYEPYSQTVGFSRRSTQGDILSACVLSSLGYDEMWVLVDRGNGYLQVEKTVLDTNINLDSYTTFSGSSISGGNVPHLAQKTCQVLVDGAVHPDVIPDAGGDFETEYAGDEISIGLFIDNRIISLPVEGTAPNVGSTRPMRKRLVDVFVKVLNSWRPKVNGQRAPNRRAATSMGEVEPARTEAFKVVDVGWGDEVQVTIEQDLPLRTEIAGWFGKIIREEI